MKRVFNERQHVQRRHAAVGPPHSANRIRDNVQPILDDKLCSFYSRADFLILKGMAARPGLGIAPLLRNALEVVQNLFTGAYLRCGALDSIFGMLIVWLRLNPTFRFDLRLYLLATPASAHICAGPNTKARC